MRKCLRRESNPDRAFRKRLFYPLNYGDAAVEELHCPKPGVHNAFGSRLKQGVMNVEPRFLRRMSEVRVAPCAHLHTIRFAPA